MSYDDAEKVKGWIGVALLVYPILRSLLIGFGVNLPEIGHLGDINLGSLLAGGAAAGGTVLLAKAPAMGNRDYNV